MSVSLPALPTDGLEAKANPRAQGVPAVRQRPETPRDAEGHGSIRLALRRKGGHPRAGGPGRRHLPGANQVDARHSTPAPCVGGVVGRDSSGRGRGRVGGDGSGGGGGSAGVGCNGGW